MKFIFLFIFFHTIVILNLPEDCLAQNADTTYRLNDLIVHEHTEKQWGITGSLNAGKYITGNLGIAHGISEQGFEIWSLSAIGANAEIIDPKRNAWGFGVEAWFNAYISSGIAVTDYTDFIHSRYCIRPMIGTGFGNWRILYGYNIRSNKNNYKLFNTNIVILNYFFPLTHHQIKNVDRKM